MANLDHCPRVSVIIPAYNVEECIERAIISVQAQSESDIEIIVVDDCSTDQTCDVVERLSRADSRIQLHLLTSNGGPSKARNEGIKAATGRWIALLDADDAMDPDRLQVMCGHGDTYELEAVGDDIVFFDAMAGEVIGIGGFVPFASSGILDLTQYLRTTTYKVGFAEALLKEEKPLSLLKLIFQRKFALETELFYNENYRYCEDFLFYLDMLYAGARVGLINKAMYLYTQPLGTASGVVSPFSRTTPDRSSIVHAVDHALVTLTRLNKKQRGLLCDRRDGARSLLNYDSFRVCNAHRSKYWKAVCALPRPRVWLRFVREMRHGWVARRHRQAAVR